MLAGDCLSAVLVLYCVDMQVFANDVKSMFSSKCSALVSASHMCSCTLAHTGRVKAV